MARAAAAKTPKQTAAKKPPKNLAKMQANPRGDWQIRDIEQVSNALGLQFHKPSRGSHYSVLSPYLPGALTIPRAKPIKPAYIKQFVSLCEAHISAIDEAAKND